jgi:hypothetical protein
MKKSKLTKCLFCGRGVMADNMSIFWEVSAQILIINHDVTRRQHGLELMMGNAAIASVMGMDEDIAKEGPSVKACVCHMCMLQSLSDLSDKVLV